MIARPLALRSAAAPAAALALLGLGCAPALSLPNGRDGARAAARWTDSGLGELEQGRAIYVSRCGRCHELALPEDQKAADWPALVARMAPKAKLSEGDRLKVERFLVTMAERPASSK